jgi:hypothetical protein
MFREMVFVGLIAYGLLRRGAECLPASVSERADARPVTPLHGKTSHWPLPLSPSSFPLCATCFPI